MAVVAAPRTRRPRACVVCGWRPRHEETYRCLTCTDDPQVAEQIRAAEMTAPDYRAQRRFLVERFNWHGGWGPVV